MNIDEFLKKHHWKYGEERWISYCEIIITEDGEIHEAIPSHERKLSKLCCKKLGVTYDELLSLIKPDMAPVEWMVDRIKAVCLWYDYGIVYDGYADNENITNALARLKAEKMIAPWTEYKISREYQLQMYRESQGWYNKKEDYHEICNKPDMENFCQ